MLKKGCLLFFALLMLGCTVSNESDFLSANTLLQKIINENPEMNITMAYLSADEVASQLQDIRTICGGQFPHKGYYRVRMLSPTMTLTAYYDPEDGMINCMHRAGQSAGPIPANILRYCTDLNNNSLCDLFEDSILANISEAVSRIDIKKNAELYANLTGPVTDGTPKLEAYRQRLIELNRHIETENEELSGLQSYFLRLLPELCMFPPGIVCDDWSIRDNAFSLSFMNSLGEAIVVTRVGSDGSIACDPATDQIILQNEENAMVTLENCRITGHTASVSIEYYRQASGRSLTHTALGKVIIR
ncbi:MAG: hypothetical protein ABH879_07045 [archaeon]